MLCVAAVSGGAYHRSAKTGSLPKLLRQHHYRRQLYCDSDEAAEEYLGSQCWDDVSLVLAEPELTTEQSDVLFTDICSNCCTRLVEAFMECDIDYATSIVVDACEEFAGANNLSVGCGGPSGPAPGYVPNRGAAPFNNYYHSTFNVLVAAFTVLLMTKLYLVM